MTPNTPYHIFGLVDDSKTLALIELAKTKGIEMVLRDIHTDQKARLDFQGRGFSRFPVVFMNGRPPLYVGDYGQVLEKLNALRSLAPVAPASEEPAQVPISDIAALSPVPARAEDIVDVAPVVVEEPITSVQVVEAEVVPTPEPVVVETHEVVTPPDVVEPPASERETPQV
jgi:hypothetical protein